MNGLCQCGCGGKTTIPKYTDSCKGYVRGVPKKFIRFHRPKMSVEQWKVDKETGCWEWMGTLWESGYGKLHQDYAHRLIFKKFIGEIPPGKVLDHLCRNRKCVNPSHLEIVTHAENCRRGSRTRLTREDVEQMRKLHAAGVKSVHIAEKYKLDKSYTGKILRNERWK